MTTGGMVYLNPLPDFSKTLTTYDYNNLSIYDVRKAFDNHLSNLVSNGILSANAAAEAGAQYERWLMVHSPILRAIKANLPSVWEELWSGRRTTLAGINPADIGLKDYTRVRPAPATRPVGQPREGETVGTDFASMSLESQYNLYRQFEAWSKGGVALNFTTLGIDLRDWDDLEVAVLPIVLAKRAKYDYWTGIFQKQTGRTFDPNSKEDEKVLFDLQKKYGADENYLKAENALINQYQTWAYEQQAISMFNDKKAAAREKAQNKYSIFSSDTKTLREANALFRKEWGEDLWTPEEYQQAMQVFGWDDPNRKTPYTFEDIANVRAEISRGISNEVYRQNIQARTSQEATTNLLRGLIGQDPIDLLVNPPKPEPEDAIQMYQRMTGQQYNPSDPVAQEQMNALIERYFKTPATPTTPSDLEPRVNKLLRQLAQKTGMQGIAKFIQSSPDEVITEEDVLAYNQWFDAINAPQEISRQEAEQRQLKEVTDITNEISKLQKMKADITDPNAPTTMIASDFGATDINKDTVAKTLDAQIQRLMQQLDVVNARDVGAYRDETIIGAERQRLLEADPMKKYLTEQPWIAAYYRKSPASRGFYSYRFTPQTRWLV